MTFLQLESAAVQFVTFLAVGFALLHVKGLVPDGSLAGCTLETLNMVGHLQSMHDFLTKGEKVWNFFFLSLSGVAKVQGRRHPYINSIIKQQPHSSVKCLSWL